MNIFQAAIQSPVAPAEVFFDFSLLSETKEQQPHHHNWGQLHLIKNGLLELGTPKQHFITPSHLAIWIPPLTTHIVYDRKTTGYCTINVLQQLCTAMPTRTTQLALSDIAVAIIDHFYSHAQTTAKGTKDQRLIDVLVDQLLDAKPERAFLPSTEHKLLSTITAKQQRLPDHSRTLAEWACRLKTTERTLARHYQQELGISFTEWRHRARYVAAINFLQQGYSVAEVAKKVGYQHSSPFITRFKKYAGMTPEQYRTARPLSPSLS